MRAGLGLALGVAMGAATFAGCDPSVVKAVCAPLSAQEFNEPPLCLGPPVMPDGAEVCTAGLGFHGDAGTDAGTTVPVCIVGPDARIYRAFVSPGTWVGGTGWTHAKYDGNASTLAAADEARCAKVLPADPGSLPACP